MKMKYVAEMATSWQLRREEMKTIYIPWRNDVSSSISNVFLKAFEKSLSNEKYNKWPNV